MTRLKKYWKGKKVVGTPVGYPENWKYTGRWNERKVAPGRWKFVFQATKRRRANSWGSFGKGTTGAWYIKGIQYIRKTNKGEYQTKLVGTKKALKFNVKKPRSAAFTRALVKRRY